MTNEDKAPPWEIRTDAAYARRAKKFLRQHPELRAAYATLLARLVADPWDARLRTHPLQGEMRGYYAVSLTHAYRALVVIVVTERAVEIVNIGTHDEVYR